MPSRKCPGTRVRFPPPPLTRLPQGGSKQTDPLAHPCGSLHFYAEIRGFLALPDSNRRPIAELTPSPPTPKKAQIEAKGSKPRDSPQVSPGLKNAVKHWTFVISNFREVLVEMPVGSRMKNVGQRVPMCREAKL